MLHPRHVEKKTPLMSAFANDGSINDEKVEHLEKSSSRSPMKL